MAQLIPNYSASIPISQQWREHLQTQEYVSDVTSAIGQSIDAYNKRAAAIEGAIQASSDSISSAVGDMAEQVSEVMVESAIAQINVARQTAAAIVGAIDQSANLITDSLHALGQTLSSRAT
jgi:hypothetical protein